jgi:DNA-directed RNA polymerase subunit RPC12/RpoP
VTKDDKKAESAKAADIARVRAEAEQRLVLRCSGCNREIARSAAREAGWRHLDSGPSGPHPCCPYCAATKGAPVATCAACGSKIAARAAAEFGWRVLEDDGELALYCPACAVKRL